MKKISIILVKLFLTFLLVLNISIIDSPISNDNSTIQIQNGTQDAILWLPKIAFFKAQYDQYGNFSGCSGKGSDCIAMPIGLTTVTISDDGVHLQ